MVFTSLDSTNPVTYHTGRGVMHVADMPLSPSFRDLSPAGKKGSCGSFRRRQHPEVHVLLERAFR
ncbi:MAG: hypothetical protein KatS3mg042_0992 [Rhodothermaceae bacterium]|nr:MAG: hypothetical protein KatS3mg042_0992 [Rhodothermaceae bacterium]